MQKTPIKQTIFCKRDPYLGADCPNSFRHYIYYGVATISRLPKKHRSLLQKNPIKETTFCKRDPYFGADFPNSFRHYIYYVHNDVYYVLSYNDLLLHLATTFALYMMTFTMYNDLLLHLALCTYEAAVIRRLFCKRDLCKCSG